MQMWVKIKGQKEEIKSERKDKLRMKQREKLGPKYEKKLRMWEI